MACVIRATKPSTFGSRNTMNAMIVMSAICVYIRRLGMPCLLLFCRNLGRKPERPAWPSMYEGPARLVISAAKLLQNTRYRSGNPIVAPSARYVAYSVYSRLICLFGMTMAMINVPMMKMSRARIIEMKIASGNCLFGFFRSLMCAAFMSMPANEKNTPAANASVDMPSHFGTRLLGAMSMAGALPWQIHTTARIVMTPNGRNVPRITPYLAMLLKALTPLVASQQQNQ